MRIALTVLGTELLLLEVGGNGIHDPAQDTVAMTYENRHSGDFQLGFTAPPTSQPLPSDVEARRI